MSTMLTVRRGAERLMLAYDIATLEQRRAPRFDDVWTLAVFDRNGRSLLHTIRNVGSQDRVHPHWQPGNRTGRIQEFFDIRRHTARSDVSFTLVGTATNSGDDRDSTTVEALITPVTDNGGRRGGSLENNRQTISTQHGRGLQVARGVIRASVAVPSITPV